ncbi:MAG: HlyD family type I secretion periplasmic adaptor subunit, partial [Pseudomonadota bacterium]|nr:HlyD family type I secretion periplasmic adaptor subunit [Pseudomonadota bacterium]
GKIIPSEHVKRIQPLEIGTVRAIHVTDGDRVIAGNPLIDLDPTDANADRVRLLEEARSAGLESARATALATGQDPLWPDIDIPQALIVAQDNLLIAERTEQRATLATLREKIGERGSSLEAAIARLAKASELEPLIAERVAARQELADKGLAAKLVALQERQELIEVRQDMSIEARNVQALHGQIKSLGQQFDQQRATFRRTALARAAENGARYIGAREELGKAESREARMHMTAPISGRVQQIAVHTVGGVVTPAQQLMVIVPEGGPIEVEAMVQNKDIGFVVTGQDAEIKLDTFPYTKYGLLHGTVRTVSLDAVTPEDKNGVEADGRGAPAYVVRVTLDEDHMRVAGQDVPLTPGMLATAEINIGKRRIIEFLMSPLLRYKQESFRER